MRRWFIALLLILVQFQLAWGAVAPFCGHEATDAGRQHFGHHEHQHQQAEGIDGAESGKSGGALVDHPDCESCHFGSSASLPPALVVTSDLLTGAEVLHALHAYRSHFPPGLERPDRSTPATAA